MSRLWESRGFQLGAFRLRFSPGEGSKLVIIIFPRHARDETRMRKIAHEFLDSSAQVLSVRFLPSSLLEIRAYELFSRIFRRRTRNPDVLFWPRLTLGWTLDPGVASASARLARNLDAHFSDVSHIIIGDSFQESSFVVKVLQSRKGANVVLSPEGIGVFRAKFGGYQWQVLDHRRMKAELRSAVFFAQFGRKEKPTKSGTASVLWGLRRLLDLCLTRDELPSNSLEIPSVDILISDWPLGVEFGIEYKSHWRPSDISDVSPVRAQNGATDPKKALFIHQPMAISAQTWLKALAALPDLGAAEITVKVHRDSRGLRDLTEALERRHLGCTVRVVKGGLAEDLILESGPGVVIGVSSTVLLNLALAQFPSKIYSVAESLRRFAAVDEQSIVQKETGHQLEALKLLGGSRIQYF